jgi:predicted metalloprotease with PDZ domain
VMLAMRDRARRLGDKSPIAPVLFAQTAKRFGLDVDADVNSVIQNGQPALLPEGVFGSCIKVVTTTIPVFDRGFDLQATIKNDRKVTNLEPGGPAERAGLREGMVVSINETDGADSQKPLTYAHKEADGTITKFTFKPEGKAKVELQQLELQPALTPERRSACVREAAGPEGP